MPTSPLARPTSRRSSRWQPRLAARDQEAWNRHSGANLAEVSRTQGTRLRLLSILARRSLSKKGVASPIRIGDQYAVDGEGVCLWEPRCPPRETRVFAQKHALRIRYQKSREIVGVDAHDGVVNRMRKGKERKASARKALLLATRQNNRAARGRRDETRNSFEGAFPNDSSPRSSFKHSCRTGNIRTFKSSVEELVCERRRHKFHLCPYAHIRNDPLERLPHALRPLLLQCLLENSKLHASSTPSNVVKQWQQTADHLPIPHYFACVKISKSTTRRISPPLQNGSKSRPCLK